MANAFTISTLRDKYSCLNTSSQVWKVFRRYGAAPIPCWFQRHTVVDKYHEEVSPPPAIGRSRLRLWGWTTWWRWGEMRVMQSLPFNRWFWPLVKHHIGKFIGFTLQSLTQKKSKFTLGQALFWTTHTNGFGRFLSLEKKSLSLG